MKRLISLIRKIFVNGVFRYLFTRYLTYFLQFVTSIAIAVKLGPYYFGIWGFILLLINYFRIADLGISNAINILLVQYKDDQKKISDYVTNSYLLLGGLSFIICLIGLYYMIFGIPFFEKYEIKNHFYVVCVIAIMTNYNVLFMTIYRVKNSLFYLSFYQSVIPVLIFLLIFTTTGETLLYSLLVAHVLGNILSIILFLYGKKLPPHGSLSITDSTIILRKGFYLFIYNISFYLIVLSVRTLISIYYSVEEFGYFSFSFSLSNSVLLFLQALTFVVFPKVIDKLKQTDTTIARSHIHDIRSSYVTMAFGLVFVALVLYPGFLYFIPKYKEAYISLGLTSLTIVLYTNSFGYGTYLMAQNKERTIALISFFSLVVNVVVAYILIWYFKVSYNYVIASTIVAYCFYSYLCVFYGKRLMNVSSGFFSNLNDCFPVSLLIPYLISFTLVIFDLQYFLIIPFSIFLLLNKRSIKEIVRKLRVITNKPDVINL